MGIQMADFIAEHRKKKNLTQKQLADMIGVTDKAVSKWERGGGYPDINYLEPLANALGVTVNALLSGKGENSENEGEGELEDAPGSKEEKEELVKDTLEYAEKVIKARRLNGRTIVAGILFALGFLGILTVSIVDVAITGRFTWSFYPILSILFVWLCALPLLLEKHRTVLIFLSFSAYLLPFLFLLEKLTGGGWFVPMGIPVSLISLAFVWLGFLVCAIKLKIWYKLALCTVLAGAANFVISGVVGRVLNEPVLDVWDLMAVGILSILALTFFFIGLGRAQKQQ